MILSLVPLFAGGVFLPTGMAVKVRVKERCLPPVQQIQKKKIILSLTIPLCF